MRPKWIFFDIGGVLIDQSRREQLRNQIIFDIVQIFISDITNDQIILAKQEASAINGNLNERMLDVLLDGDDIPKARCLLSKRLHELKDESLLCVRPEAKNVVALLAKEYKLGMIANQSVNVKIILKNTGILEHFSHTGVSDDYNFAKPDPRIFYKVLQETDADSKESAFVDDNIERGLIPAKKLGFTTVWMYDHERKGLPPQNVVDLTIHNLEEILVLW